MIDTPSSKVVLWVQSNIWSHNCKQNLIRAPRYRTSQCFYNLHALLSFHFAAGSTEHWQVESDEAVDYTQCTIDRGEEQRDEGKRLLPASQRVNNLTDELQNNQAQEIYSFHWVHQPARFTARKKKKIIRDNESVV